MFLQPAFLSVISFILWSLWTLNGVVSDPQTDFVYTRCTPPSNTVVFPNSSIFHEHVNATFQDIKEMIITQRRYFAMAREANAENPVSTLFQCRNYVSNRDCVVCFDVAAKQISLCSPAAQGAGVVYDGCFLSGFFQKTTEDFNGASWGNQTVRESTTTLFTSLVQQVLKNLQTTTPRKKGFFRASKIQLPNNNGTTIYAFAQCIETISESGCFNCLNTGYSNMQTCLPYSDGRAYADGCFMRYSTSSFFPHDYQQVIDITPSGKQGSSKKGVIIGEIVGGVVAFVLILLTLLAYIRQPKRHARVPRGDITGASKLKGPEYYNYGDLKSATNNFSIENKLGEGGFGVVYKGTLKNGKVVAVKKLTLRRHSKRVEEEFESEVRLISNVHHRNLVRLLGSCSKGDERVLVYEYFVLGYIAPKYVIHGQLSEKVDIYSFGVVILEIISGQTNRELEVDGDSEGEYLLRKAWKLYERGIHLELVDNTLNPNDYDAEEVKQIIEISLLCTQAAAESRPTMSEVVVLLQKKGLSNSIKPTMPILIEVN